MKTETPSAASRQPDVRSARVLLVVLLLGLAACLFVVQRVQGNTQAHRHAGALPDGQQQPFGSVPPPPTPGPPSNLIAYMPIVFNNPIVIGPPDVRP